MTNLYRLFQEQFPQDLSRCFIETKDGKIYSYEDLINISSAIATAMIEAGVCSGDRVIVQVNKTPEAVFLYLACLKIGAILVPLNISYTSSELSYFLDDIEPRLVVCDPASPMIKDDLLSKQENITLLTLDSQGKGTLIERANDNSHKCTIADVKTDDIACILYTSGTTGKPKGAMITHGNLASNALALHQCWGFNEKDILLHALPIFHVHGLFVAINCVLINGTSMIFLPGFDINDVITFLPRATVLMGVPTFYTRLLAHPEFTEQVFKNIRLFISGSAPLLKEVSDDFYEKTKHRVLERYGMTETVMIASNPLNGERKAGTVGQALTDIQIRITSADGKRLKVGEVGDIQVSGPNVFKGYWRNPEKTKEEFTEDRFFKTGDVGFLDKQGYLSIVGRSKDLIISGGYNVYPKEIENIINEREYINESAVVGVTHPDLGEGIIAIVVMEKGYQFDEKTLISFLKQHLAIYKVPKIIINVDELPRNVMGKIMKNILRDQYQHSFDKNRVTN
jgi:malonyl-CoA/methylmalonyl-CoA synthetase